MIQEDPLAPRTASASMTRVLAFPTLAAVATISLALVFLATRGVSAPLPLVVASVVGFSYVTLASGRLALRAAHASDLPLVAAWSLGVAVTGLVLLALVALFSVTAAVAFALWAVVVIALDIAAASKARQQRTDARTDLIALALCCVLVVVWCKDLAAVPATLADSGRFQAWTDYFLHAGVISQFGDPRAIGRGGIWLADTPWFVYHYASYTLPAVFAWPLDQPGLALATSIWAPIGVLCLAGSSYALGAALAGPAGGIAALVALFLLPDASNYGLRNGFFSFHWCLLASPTTGYVLGTALLGVVFLHRWAQTRSPHALATSAALALGTAVFRAHVFLLFFPVWLLVVALTARVVQRRTLLVIVLAGALAIAGFLALGPDLPAQISWAFDEGRALERFLYFAHRRQEPTAYQGLYQRIVTDYGEGVGFAAGILLVYPACLGIFVILYPLVLFLRRQRAGLPGIDAFPLVLLAGYAALLLVAPIPGQHDATEFTHRPFPLVYALVASWTAASLVRWLSEQANHGIRLWQTLLAATAIALPFLWVNAAELSRPKFYWSRPFDRHVVASDLLSGAKFLRSQARPGDTFASWPLTTRNVGVDAASEIVALTGLPAYLARPWIHEVFRGTSRVTAANRLLALGEVARARDVDQAMQQLRSLGLRWYAVTSVSGPAWDIQRGRAAWARGTVAIYDSGTGHALKPGTP